jgi:adenylyl cyclase-associated protein
LFVDFFPEVKSVNMDNRLEAATSRLEDLATITPPGSEDALAPTTPAAGSRVALPTLAATGNASAAPPPPAAEPLPQSVEEFDEIIGSEVANYVALSEEIGGLIAEQVRITAKPPIGKNIGS